MATNKFEQGTGQGILMTILGAMLGESERRRIEEGIKPFEPREPGRTPSRGYMNRQFSDASVGARVPRPSEGPGQAAVSQAVGGASRIATPGGNIGRQLFEQALAGEAARFGSEMELEQDFAGGVRDYVETYEEGVGEMRGALGDVKEQRETGLSEIATARDTAAEFLSAGQEQVRGNLSRGLLEIGAQVQSFQQQADQLLGQMVGLRGEALEASADQSARLLNNVTVGIQQKLNAEVAEIEGRADIPVGAREAMKQRARFLNGQSLNDTAVQVMAGEAIRLDSVRSEHDGMIASVSQSLVAAQAGVRGAAVAGGVSLAAQTIASEAALASAGAQMSTMFADMGRQYRTSMTQQASVLQTQLTAMAIQGRTDIVNMILAQPRAYLDLTPIFADMFNVAWSAGMQDFNIEMSTHSAMLAQFGLTENTFYQPTLLTMQAGLQNLNQQIAPKGGNWEQDVAGFVEAGASLLGTAGGMGGGGGIPAGMGGMGAG